jgi:Flp pilus assembly CpaE family ATPase
VTRLPVLTAVTDAVWEADLVAAFQRSDVGLSVVRRCVDLADLLATAATGTARAALVSADLRRLDRDALTRLARAGVAVVGLVPSGDEAAERRLRQLGVAAVLPAGATPAEVAAAVTAAANGSPAPAGALVQQLGEPRDALADPLAAVGAGAVWFSAGGAGAVGAGDEASAAVDLAAEGEMARLPGRVVAVWGPTGAPGRTTVAVGVATELAALGVEVLLLDADVYGGVVAQSLGLLDETPGLAAACREANAGSLDVAGLARHARTVAGSLRVLTGISRADRWIELRPASLEVVLRLARASAAVTVLDCGFCLEQDEELSYDTAAPRRNGATLTALSEADVVLAVGAGDPVGLQRLVRGLGELRDAVPGVEPRVVVNRVRKGAVPGAPEREIRAALARYAGLQQVHVLPQDVAACDAAASAGRSLGEAAPTSPVRAALAALARDVAGAAAPPAPRRRGLRRRAG